MQILCKVSISAFYVNQFTCGGIIWLSLFSSCESSVLCCQHRHAELCHSVFFKKYRLVGSYLCVWGKLCITVAASLIIANKDGRHSFITSQCGGRKPDMNAVLLDEGRDLSVRLSCSISSQEPSLQRTKTAQTEDVLNLKWRKEIKRGLYCLSQNWLSLCFHLCCGPLLATILAL